VLGAGSFGKVFLGHNKKNSEHKVAIKVISKRRFQNELDFIRQEFRILSILDHPNIVKYYETYEDLKYLYMVMEYCPGGELFDKIADRSSYTEKEASQIMEDIFRAISHCHSINVTHRDIKPENLMYGEDGKIKLIDFGLAKQSYSKLAKMTTLAGTPYFISPEVLKGVYGRECDMWSLGVLLYIILSGEYPFDADSRIEVFDKISSGKISFRKHTWKHISDEAKDLIYKLLQLNIKKRLTAQSALKHPWFTKFNNHSPS
jgi:calcium-dependent protein kinase